MIMKRMIAASIALTLLGSSAAFAQAGENRYGQSQIDVQNRNSSQAQDRNNYGQEQGRNDRQVNSNNDVRDNPHWSRGDKLSSEYRSNQYVVSDWKANRLRQPPRGYHWVQANNQYVLAAVATGVIADIIMNTQRAR
jgi:Ni/Co efflux regulator RcnB